ncbi:MAG: PorT family protein, partial [Bacteroides sp.]|nr:PorT family protein [Bacteroides sp.]
MKHRLFVILFMLVALPIVAQQRDLKDYAGDKKVNFGVKGGFNSSMMLISHLSVDGQNISNIQNEYKIGYFASLFMR